MSVKKIKLSDLIREYNENPVPVAAEKLGISRHTMMKLLKENNIPLKGKGNRDPKVCIIDDIKDKE